MGLDPAFLFAHGAGAGASSTWMQAWAARLESLGPVTAFDYPYMRAGRRTPDRPEVLTRVHAEALMEARRAGATAHAKDEGASGDKAAWFLIGKSMGSRIGCHVANSHPTLVRGVVCLGYPLVAAGGGAVRDQVLLALEVPILFVQGTRDPLCPLDRLRAVCERMQASARIVAIEGANHSLEIGRKKTNPSGQDAVDAEILSEIRRFVTLRCASDAPAPEQPLPGPAS